MITGDRSLAAGKRGAFYNTLEEFHRYWDRIDIIVPKTINYKLETRNYFGNVYIHPSPWPLIFQPWWIFKRGKEIYREQKFDLMTVHEYPPFYNGIGTRLLWGKIKTPYILEAHHIPGHPRAGSFKEKVYKYLWTCFAKWDSAKALAIRVVNQKETPAFLIKAGVTREKIKHIPSMYIDLDIFKLLLEVEKKYDLVFASRLEKNKGIFNLVEAVKIVKQQKPNIRLLIIGNGPEREKLKLKTINYKLETNIIFSGWLETPYDVAKAYNSAKIFVNPSFNEGGPRVALEAMACGLPVITTKVGLTNDLINDGENGLFTDWNPEDMAKKIIYLLNHLELQEKFSQAGRVIAHQFERKEMIRNYAESLQKLL